MNYCVFLDESLVWFKKAADSGDAEGQYAYGSALYSAEIERYDEGYEWIKDEYGINIEKEEQPMNKVSIGVCATKEYVKNGTSK